MKKRVRLLIGIVVGLMVLTALPLGIRADGVIIPEPPPDIDPVRVANLAIKYHHVEVTIDHQVATTKIDQVFVNEHPYEIEGTYIFPVPKGASVTDFAMWVDGKRLSAQLLDADEARRIYEGIVRRRQDPAILEYLGSNAFRARIYPIPARGQKRVQLEYSQVLQADQGIITFVYPLGTEKFSSRPLEQVSVLVSIESGQPIKSVYSGSHEVVVTRPDDYHATVSFEEEGVTPDQDFELYYTVSEEDFGLNVLSYREAGEDGFFLLLVAPKVDISEEEIVAKDVICVLDVSGSMRGDKLVQAKEALEFVLDSLHEEDRFNIIAFSTAVRQYSRELVPATGRADARQFVRNLRAAGGTNIDRALSEALRQATGERPQIVIFLTDGLATEGVTDTAQIIRNVETEASQTVRLFTFGLGYQVNTILLDTMAQSHKGASAYVQPGQSVETEVSTFYAKVSTPLLADLELIFGGIDAEDMYPYPLPDLFAGSQLVVVGRYRGGGSAELKMHGTLDGERRTFSFDDLYFSREGGPQFIARLWATRKVGYLLNQIRLHGEERELTEEVVDLSIRYGIVTPYTSFLVDETEDALSDTGRERIVREQARIAAESAGQPSHGEAAVEKSVGQETLRRADAAPSTRHEQVRNVADKTFVLRNGVWTDTTFEPSKMKTNKVAFGSDAYFRTLSQHPEWGRYFALGNRVIVVLGGEVYEVIDGPASGDTTEPSPTSPPAKRVPHDPLGLWERVWEWIASLLG